MAQFYDSGIVVPSQLLQAALVKGVSGPIAINNYEELTLLVAYTRGGAAGSIQYQVQFSLDKLTWYAATQFEAAAIVAGTDVNIASQKANIVYVATSASQELVTSVTFTVIGNFFRVIFGELGNAGAPGTAEIKYYLRGTQT